MERLGRTLSSLYAVSWVSGEREWLDNDGQAWTRADLRVRWGARPIALPDIKPTIYCELGWLPRWSYQVSHKGINADHHLAGQVPKAGRDEKEAALQHLRNCRQGVGWTGWDAVNPCVRPYLSDRPFFLVPLQVSADTNMRHVPERIRTAQGLIDNIQKDLDFPHRVIFKAHPASDADPPESLSLDKGRDDLLIKDEHNVHALLKSEDCRGVITGNSNVAHDALMWGVPTVVLGRGFWGDKRPAGLDYVAALMRAQWSMADAANEERVRAAAEEAMRE